MEVESDENQNQIEKDVGGGRRALCAVDWLEYRGCGQWIGNNALEWIERLEHAKNLAALSHKEEPLEIAGHCVMVSSSGMGRGRQSHMEYAMTWGSVFFAVAERDSDDMKHANLYVKIPGEACVINGEAHCRNVVDEILEEIGFAVRQDSVSRIDVCLDVVGMALQDSLLPSCERGQMKGSLMKSGDSLALHGQPRTGLSLGSRKSIRVNFYDKLHEAIQKGGQYLESMRVQRWNGVLPEKAFRLEYQISKDWLRRWSLASVEGVLSQLPDIVEKLTNVAPFPLWVITESVPDRKNKNQSRCGVHQDWNWVVGEFQKQSGQAIQPLKSIESNNITPKTAYQFVRGYLTSAAAVLKIPVKSFEDSFEVLRELHQRNDGTDEEWKERWMFKVRKSGALEEMMSFPFGSECSPDQS